MEIPEIKEILEKNCGDDKILIEVTRNFFKIELSPKKTYNEGYDEIIREYYDKR